MSRRAKIIAGVVLAIVLAVVAAVLWWTLRGAEPAAVDLGAAVAQLDASANGAPETESVEAEPEAGGEGTAPVAEAAVTAGEAGTEVADVAPDVAVRDDAPSGGAEGEPERAADAGSEAGGEGAAPDGGPEVGEDVGAAPDDGPEVADVTSDDPVAEDVAEDAAPGGAGGEPERAVAEAGPDGDDGAAPVAEEVGTAPDDGSEVADVASDDPVSDDASPAGGGTEPETPAVDAGTSGLAGLWKLITAEGADALAGEGAVSFAGFRVQEVLAGGIGENTAVGRTAEVSGYIELTDTALMTTNVIVHMGTLRTDDSHRDHHMREVLDTGEFPLAAFTLTEPIELPAGSAVGEPFSGSARGDLTIKGVTNSAVFDLQAQLVGDVIVVVGSSEVVFSDFGVPTPTSTAVLSVEDHGVMEFQLYFAR